MPVLDRAKYEQFCQAFVFGPHAGNATAAFRSVGYADHGTAASRLRRRPEVKARINELREQRAQIERVALAAAIERLANSKEKTLARFARLYCTIAPEHLDPEGSSVPDPSHRTDPVHGQRTALHQVLQRLTEMKADEGQVTDEP